MRYAFLVFIIMTTACSETDRSARCFDRYMAVFDGASPGATTQERTVAKREATATCHST